MRRWWIVSRGENIGPIAEDMVLVYWQNGRIAADSQACVEGTEHWLPVSYVPLIAARIRGVPVPGPAVARKSSLPRVPVWLLVLTGLMCVGIVIRVFGG